MNEIQIELTKLIGQKDKYLGEFPEVNARATLTDLHRFLIGRTCSYFKFSQNDKFIGVYNRKGQETNIPYDSDKELLEQEESTLTQILDLILSNQ